VVARSSLEGKHPPQVKPLNTATPSISYGALAGNRQLFHRNNSQIPTKQTISDGFSLHARQWLRLL
jgi:hypothetical protein